MTATMQKMEIWTGDDIVQPVQIVNEYGAPEPLGGYTEFTWTVRDKPKGEITVGPLLFSDDQVLVIGDAEDGLVHIIIASADTADYAVGGRFVDHHQELEGLKEGKVKTLMEGPIRIHQSISGVGTGVTP